jgi:hypothetical protein
MPLPISPTTRLYTPQRAVSIHNTTHIGTCPRFRWHLPLTTTVTLSADVIVTVTVIATLILTVTLIATVFATVNLIVTVAVTVHPQA